MVTEFKTGEAAGRGSRVCSEQQQINGQRERVPPKSPVPKFLPSSLTPGRIWRRSVSGDGGCHVASSWNMSFRVAPALQTACLKARVLPNHRAGERRLVTPNKNHRRDENSASADILLYMCRLHHSQAGQCRNTKQAYELWRSGN